VYVPFSSSKSQTSRAPLNIYLRELRVAGGDGRREASFWRYEMNALAAVREI
jgi:hypothetical protein